MKSGFLKSGFFIFGHTPLRFSICEVLAAASKSQPAFSALNCLQAGLHSRGKWRRQSDVLNSCPFDWYFKVCFGFDDPLTNPCKAARRFPCFTIFNPFCAHLPSAGFQPLTSSSWICTSSWPAKYLWHFDARQPARSGFEAHKMILPLRKWLWEVVIASLQTPTILCWLCHAS